MEKEMGQTHSKTAIWYLQKAATVTKTLSYCSRSPTSIDKHNWGRGKGEVLLDNTSWSEPYIYKVWKVRWGKKLDFCNCRRLILNTFIWWISTS